MALLVEEDEAPNSVDIGTFGANTIVFETNGMTDEIVAGSFSFRMGVAYWGEKEQKGFVPHGVLLARHAPHEPKPFALR
jgi:hypothetical protein